MKITRTLERGVSVMNYLEHHKAASLAELAKGTDLSKATLLRLLATLIDCGWVYRRINDGRYALAICIGGDSRSEIGWTKLARAAAPILQALTERTGYPADLTTVTDTGFLEVIESTRQRVEGWVDYGAIGFRPSMVLSAPGRAILAACDREQRRGHIDVVLKLDIPAERIHITCGALDRELKESARRGYAKRESGYWPNTSEFGEEPMDIAVPIHFDGHPSASVGIVWPVDRSSPQEVADRYLGDLRSAASKIVDVIR